MDYAGQMRQQFISFHKLSNSAFHPYRVGKSSMACLAGVKARCIHLCWVAGNTM